MYQYMYIEKVFKLKVLAYIAISCSRYVTGILGSLDHLSIFI